MDNSYCNFIFQCDRFKLKSLAKLIVYLVRLLNSSTITFQVSDVKEKDKRPARPTSDSEKKDTDTTDGPNQPTNRKPPPRPVSLPKIEKGDDIVNKNVSKSTNENRSSTESKPSPKGIYIVTSGTVENDNSTPPPVAPPRRKRKQKKEALAKTQVPQPLLTTWCS